MHITVWSFPDSILLEEGLDCHFEELYILDQTNQDIFFV